MFISRHLLANLKSVQLRPHSPAHFRRNFSLTPRPRASEDLEALTNFKHTSLFRKLADKPDALRALVDLTKMMKTLGVDVTTGKPPSSYQMLKLAMNSEFREASNRVVEELQKAGIDVASQEVMNELMSLSKRKP